MKYNTREKFEAFAARVAEIDPQLTQRHPQLAGVAVCYHDGDGSTLDINEAVEVLVEIWCYKTHGAAEENAAWEATRAAEDAILQALKKTGIEWRDEYETLADGDGDGTYLTWCAWLQIA